MKTEIRECNVHGSSTFVLRKDGRYRCRQCSVDSVHRRRHRLKEMAIEYKGGKCEKCGYDKCKNALDFHHTDPTKKEFTVSSANKSWESIKKELDKCIMVCANCHREIHFEIEQNKKLV